MSYPGHEKDLERLGAHIKGARRSMQLLDSEKILDELVIIIVGGARPPLGPKPPLTTPAEMQLLMAIAEQIESHATQLGALANSMLTTSRAIVANAEG